MAPSATPGPTSITAKTCDGTTRPDENARPDIPVAARSSAIVSVAASRRERRSRRCWAAAAVSNHRVSHRTEDAVGDPAAQSGAPAYPTRRACLPRPESHNRRSGRCPRPPRSGACERRAGGPGRATTSARAMRPPILCRQHERVGAERGDLAGHPPSQCTRVAGQEPP
jgi:hypothetical protein